MEAMNDNEKYLMAQILLLRKEYEQLQLEHGRQSEKLYELEQTVAALTRSKPWRYYTGIRVGTHMVLACHTKAGCKNLLKTILLHTKDYINSRPGLKQKVMSLLRYFPDVTYRLKKLGRIEAETEHYNPEFNKNAQIIYNRLRIHNE